MGLYQSGSVGIMFWSLRKGKRAVKHGVLSLVSVGSFVAVFCEACLFKIRRECEVWWLGVV